MHQIPTHPNLREKWVKFVQRHRKDFKLEGNYTSLCSAHFEASCYNFPIQLEGIQMNRDTVLIKGSVPMRYTIIAQTCVLKNRGKRQVSNTSLCFQVVVYNLLSSFASKAGWIVTACFVKVNLVGFTYKKLVIRKTGNSLLSLFRWLKSRLNFDYCSKVRQEVMSAVNKERRLNDACDQLSAHELEEQTETTLPYDHSNSSSCSTLGPITKETCAVPQTLTPVSENKSQCCSHQEVLKRTQCSNKRFKKIPYLLVYKSTF